MQSEVINLYQQRRFGAIHGPGPRRISDIEASLITAGLITAPVPASEPTGAPQ
jgi:hypothetical protein